MRLEPTLLRDASPARRSPRRLPLRLVAVLVALVAAWMTAGHAAAAASSTVAEVCACNASAYTYGGAVYAYDAPARLSSSDTVATGTWGSPSGPGAVSWVSPVSAESDVDAANTARAGAADVLAGRALNVNGRTVTYGERVIARAATEPGPMHSFPAMYDGVIIGQGAPTVTPSGYTRYSLPGTINGTAGMYEIGGWPNAAGNAFEITHRFFRQGG